MRVNYNNALPVYTRKDFQMWRQIGTEFPYGLPCSRQTLIPIQFKVDGTGITNIRWKLVSPQDDVTELDLLDGLLQTHTDGVSTWVVFNVGIDGLLPCGYWYIHFEIGENSYYTEVLDITNIDNPFEYWSLKFDNGAVDMKGHGLLHQIGFTPLVYILPVFDTPTVENEREFSEKLDGTRVLSSSRTRQKLRFEFPFVPDYLIGWLSMCGEYSQVILKNEERGEQYVLTGCVFTSRRSGVFSIGLMEGVLNTSYLDGCDDNIILV